MVTVDGFVGVFKMTKMDSFHLLLQLPAPQLEEILTTNDFTDVIVPLSKYAQVINIMICGITLHPFS